MKLTGFDASEEDAEIRRVFCVVVEGAERVREEEKENEEDEDEQENKDNGDDDEEEEEKLSINVIPVDISATTSIIRKEISQVGVIPVRLYLSLFSSDSLFISVVKCGCVCLIGLSMQSLITFADYYLAFIFTSPDAIHFYLVLAAVAALMSFVYPLVFISILCKAVTLSTRKC